MIGEREERVCVCVCVHIIIHILVLLLLLVMLQSVYQNTGNRLDTGKVYSRWHAS